MASAAGMVMALLMDGRSGRAAAAPATATATAPTTAAGERRFSIIYTAEVHGAIEPCGCTSDPLGDLSRFAEVVRAAKRQSGAVLLVDAGGLLYPEGSISARERASADLKATFLADQLAKLGLGGAGLAETDLSGGVALLRPKRLASNLSAPQALAPPQVQMVGGVKVGVLGVADPALAERVGGRGEEVVSAARRDADRLRRQGAEVIVVVAAVDKALARRVAREAAVDFVVVGRQVGAGMPRAEPVSRTDDAGATQRAPAAAFLVAPAEELQRVGRIDVLLRGGAVGLRDAGGVEAIRSRQDELDRAIQRLDAELARWSVAAGVPSAGGAPASGAQSDASFIAAKRREREELGAERAKLTGGWTAPAQGSYFINRLIALSRSLPRDATVVAAMKRLDARTAAINLAQAQPPPPPEPGRASYVGMASCAGCHKAAVQLWKRTVHAGAWKTLVDGGKQADYKCVGCHLTGYGQVGGSSLGFTKGLESIQCEDCHGPASIHVAQKGLEEPSSLRRQTPETTCLACHNEQHSDTFQYQAYLRDVLGPGHGAQARQKLGDGPTGHSLRTAALAKAKRAGAEQLRKM
jgi:hypothetical protein